MSNLRLSKKAKNYQNLKTESESKQRIYLLQEQVVIQAVNIQLCFRSKESATGF